MAKQSGRKERRGSNRPQTMSWFRAGFQHHQRVAVESLERLLAELGSSLLTWGVLGIALALPICLMLLLQNLQQVSTGFENAGQISLYIEANLNDDEIAQLQTTIQTRPEVASVELISSSQALEEFQRLSGFGDALNGLDENPLPAVLIVNPGSESPQQIESLFMVLSELGGVESAQLDLEWIQKLYSILELAQRLTMVLAVLLGVGVILVIGNTVRLTIESRRAEIVVVKLVGGTDAYVARPFLYTGLWYGVGGGVFATVLVVAALFGLQGPVSRIAGLYESSFTLLSLDISNVLLVVIGSGMLGLLGAWLSVLRHLKAIEPR